MGVSLFLKKPKTDHAAGIAMVALAVFHSNKCGAHETFHGWSIPPYTAAFVVPRVSVGVSVGVSQAFLRAKSAESQSKTSKETLEERLAR